ncbi:MAG: hypothetical protein ACREJ2_12470 [Planctomycetota bacterium]
MPCEFASGWNLFLLLPLIGAMAVLTHRRAGVGHVIALALARVLSATLVVLLLGRLLHLTDPGFLQRYKRSPLSLGYAWGFLALALGCWCIAGWANRLQRWDNPALPPAWALIPAPVRGWLYQGWVDSTFLRATSYAGLVVLALCFWSEGGGQHARWLAFLTQTPFVIALAWVHFREIRWRRMMSAAAIGLVALTFAFEEAAYSVQGLSFVGNRQGSPMFWVFGGTQAPAVLAVDTFGFVVALVTLALAVQTIRVKWRADRWGEEDASRARQLRRGPVAAR